MWAEKGSIGLPFGGSLAFGDRDIHVDSHSAVRSTAGGWQQEEAVPIEMAPGNVARLLEVTRASPRYAPDKVDEAEGK